jgi:hypothetical protein
LKENAPSLSGLLWSYAASGVLLLAVTAHAALTGTAATLFTRDPAAIYESDPFFGALSSLGVVLWAAAASIALFTAGLLPRTARKRQLSGFLFAAGAFTSWLLLDDLFMLHERVIPDSLGIPQTAIILAYAAIVAALLVRYRAVIALTDYRPLVLALGFFAASVIIDQGPGGWHQWAGLVLVEDGAKLFGIVSWFVFFATTAKAAALSRLNDRVSAPAEWPSRSRTPAGAVMSRADSPTRAALGSIPVDARRARPGSLPVAPLQSRRAD